MSKRELAELVYNRVIAHLPHTGVRIRALRELGATIGPNVYLFGGSEILGAQHLEILGNCHIGRHCQIDARGGLTIGTNVAIASFTALVTADHDINDPMFRGRLGPITIGDRVWLATRTMVVKDVVIGEGAVAAAGSVIVDDVPPWAVVAGVPARVVGERPRDQRYEIDYGPTLY